MIFLRRANLKTAKFILAREFKPFQALDLLYFIGMNLEEISGQIKICANMMNTHYGSVVFDEWAIVSLAENKARVLYYTGPRNDNFLANFVKDLGVLRAGLNDGNYGAGDFEFSRQGVGTSIEAFLVLGQENYLFCNNTRETMDTITKNPRWLMAQVPFAELAERIRMSPLNVSWGTQFFYQTLSKNPRPQIFTVGEIAG